MERPLTEYFRPDGKALSLQEYEQVGGYQALRQVVQQMAQDAVIQEVEKANVLGRGGAGFPAGRKWSFMPKVSEPPPVRYVVCNADEMEPGTFKDRVLMEGNPHQLIEGTAIAAWAIGARRAYVYVRAEYHLAVRRLEKAIAEAYAGHYLGDHILGSSTSLDMILHVSAGRYMCGEASAMLNVIEGRRANPRQTPPHLTGVGLWAKPTLVNNVETLVNVPPIINRGADWFLGLSHTDEGGTKIYCVSGRVKKPGFWELPMGTPLREIIEEHAGGMLDGFKLRALLPGGASTAFVREQDIDTPMSFASMKKIKSSLGTGAIIVLDDKTCPVGMLRNLAQFYLRESCGWCTPCWGGLAWIVELLTAIENGQGKAEDVEILAHHTRMLLPDYTFCALASTAMDSLRSGLEYFHDDFEQHIREQRCPWR